MLYWTPLLEYSLLKNVRLISQSIECGEGGLKVNKCSDVEWTDMIYVKWFYFGVKWIEMSYVEVLGDKSTMYIKATFYWGYLIVLWLFYLVSILYCVCFNLFCNVCVWRYMYGFCNIWVCTCMGFLIYGVCVCRGFVMCGCLTIV